MAVTDDIVTNDHEDHLLGQVMEILRSLDSSLDDITESKSLQVIPLKGAMTNKVFQINWLKKTGEHKVLVRLYGEGVDVFFDRADEIQTFEYMSKHGQGPRLLARSPIGRIEEFIHARTLSASDMKDHEISALIAAKLREFNDLDMPGPRKVHLWDRMRNWVKKAKGLCSPEEVKEFCLDALDEEILELEKKLSADHQCVGFCHNDLQYGNIMIDEKTRSITIIDYEYAGYNPVAYDIANHFCEKAADYHSDKPHILDFSQYPDLKKRKSFVHVYLSSSGNEPRDHEVEQLLEDIEKYTLASHLLWRLWGIISDHVNKIVDFNYAELARQKFKQYWLQKSTILENSGPSSTVSIY
ncbi:probable choline kinase 2 [Macadamia integrifolia]|uniref:probable choline kinase 2 n=1 Tax=Macadamia integrifolia TaxID=60698 RepID=UPI001C4FA5A3|nr:probable choline kinase 2 [Macadamia integrifolia]XP_042495660.1 probable choline kinase 2 [Macadamia integrifolia]